MKKLSILFSAAFILLLTGCVQKRSEPYDYSALIESKPKSILVVMPTNSSPDVKGSTSVLARATVPLAELGYYVYPVALVDETFKQNGLTDGNAIQSAGIKKIREIFGADSIMYLDVVQYGSSYRVFDSITTVEVKGKLVDLRNGKTLWEGQYLATEGNNVNSNNGLAQILITAISQAVNTVNDKGYTIAAPAVYGLFHSGDQGGLLHGPRLPKVNSVAK